MEIGLLVKIMLIPAKIIFESYFIKTDIKHC